MSHRCHTDCHLWWTCAELRLIGRLSIMLWIVLLVAAFALLSFAQLYQMSNVLRIQPTSGRLIRVRTHRSDIEATIYARGSIERGAKPS
jgi:hypothetical protein